MERLIIDGNSVYELDEECLKRKELREKQKRPIQKDNGKVIEKKKGH